MDDILKDEILKSFLTGAAGGLAIYILNFGKEFLFKHIDKLFFFNKYKFEKTYNKRVEIIEKINLELGKALSSTDELFSTFDELISSKEPNDLKKDKLEKYKIVSKLLRDFSGYLNYAELYLPSEFFLNKVIVITALLKDSINRYYLSNLTTGFMKISFNTNGEINRQFIKTEELSKSGCRYERNEIEKRIREIVKLSKNYINNKNFDKDFKPITKPKTELQKV